jgi:hypothetical protein
MSTKTFRIPSFTAIDSFVFAVTSFSFSAWRLEQSEENSVVRDASSQVFTTLAEYESDIYISHYDGDRIIGSPWFGLMKIGLLNDLSMLIGENGSLKSATLNTYWAEVIDLARQILFRPDSLAA